MKIYKFMVKETISKQKLNDLEAEPISLLPKLNIHNKHKCTNNRVNTS